jgi:putative endonuclease
MYYVYILYSKDLDRYYIGSTSDTQPRLTKHLSEHSGFTGKAKDWEIVWTELQENKTAALVREKQIKKWKSRKMIMQLIDDKNQL